jgi:hypothetical protein
LRHCRRRSPSTRAPAAPPFRLIAPPPPAPTLKPLSPASLGLYFVTRVLARDAAAAAAHWRARGPAFDPALAALYTLAAAAESVDVLALAMNVAGMALSSGLLPPGALPAAPPLESLPAWAAAAVAALPPLPSLPSLPALLAAADRTSLACAAMACAAGLSAEALKGARALRGGGGRADSGADDEAAGSSSSCVGAEGAARSTTPRGEAA